MSGSDDTATPSRAAVRRGRLVAEGRDRLGLTQAALAALLGVHLNTVKLIEAGKRGPGADLLRKLDRVLALGERRRGEAEPLYLIASVDGDEPVPLRDAEDRHCVVRARHPASQVVEFLRGSGVASVDLVPVWRAHLDTLPPGQCVGLNVDDVELAAYHAGLLRWASEALERHGRESQ